MGTLRASDSDRSLCADGALGTLRADNATGVEGFKGFCKLVVEFA